MRGPKAGLRPYHITDLVRYSEEFAKSSYGFHSYLAHGPVGTGTNLLTKVQDKKRGRLLDEGPMPAATKVAPP